MIASLFLTIYHLIFGFSRSKFFWWISFLVLFIFLAFRGVYVGTDTVVYANMFEEYRMGLYFNLSEPGWLVLNKVIDFLGGDFNTLLWFSALLTLVPVFYGVRKNSLYPLFSIFIYLTFYYYFYSFNIIRQSIAQGFIFLSYCYFNLEERPFKQNKKVYLYFFIGLLFHYTSVIFIPLLGVLYFIKNNNFNKYFVLLSSFVLGIGFNEFILKFAQIFLTSYKEETISENFLSGLINLLILNIAFIGISYFIENKDKWYYGFFLFIFLSNVMNGISYGNRLVMFTGMFLLIFFPALFRNLRIDRRWNLILFLCIVSYSYFRYIRLFGSGQIFPYENTLLNLIIKE